MSYRTLHVTTNDFVLYDGDETPSPVPMEIWVNANQVHAIGTGREEGFEGVPTALCWLGDQPCAFYFPQYKEDGLGAQSLAADLGWSRYPE